MSEKWKLKASRSFSHFHFSHGRPMQMVTSLQTQLPLRRKVDLLASRASQPRMWLTGKLTQLQPSSGGPTGISDETGVEREELEELCASEVSLSDCWCDLIMCTDQLFSYVIVISCYINITDMSVLVLVY